VLVNDVLYSFEQRGEKEMDGQMSWLLSRESDEGISEGRDCGRRGKEKSGVESESETGENCGVWIGFWEEGPKGLACWL